MNKNSPLNQRYICPIGADGIHFKKDAYGQDRSLYSLRHLGIQMRLVKSGGKTNLLFLAKNCGTSVEMIERFYCKYLPLDKKVIENLQRIAS